MKVWIARAESGDLKLYQTEPRQEVSMLTGGIYWNDRLDSYKIDDRLFPEVTFENSPIEVELKLMREDVVEANYNAIADYEDFLGLVSCMRKAQIEANDMIARVECYQEAQDYIKKAEELELMVDKFIEERT